MQIIYVFCALDGVMDEVNCKLRGEGAWRVCGGQIEKRGSR